MRADPKKFVTWGGATVNEKDAKSEKVLFYILGEGSLLITQYGP